MRGLRTDRTAQTIITGHAFMQNLRRRHSTLDYLSAAAHETKLRNETQLRQVA